MKILKQSTSEHTHTHMYVKNIITSWQLTERKTKRTIKHTQHKSKQKNIENTKQNKQNKTQNKTQHKFLRLLFSLFLFGSYTYVLFSLFVVLILLCCF